MSIGGGDLADELRKEIQSLRIRVEQLEAELDVKNSDNQVRKIDGCLLMSLKVM